jgi:guanylate kinase
MMPYVITLTGPSQCGKSEVIRILQQLSRADGYADFYPVPFQKYTTREFRDDEIEAILTGKAHSLDQKPVIGEYNNNGKLNAKSLNDAKILAFQGLGCDLAYEQYGDRYGLRLVDLYEHMKKGETPIVILNDVRTVEDIKTKLGGQCFSIFIFRETPNIDHFTNIGHQRGESVAKTKIRFQKAESIYRIYIENIHIFDKLILNVEDSTESKFVSLEKILGQLISYLCKPMPRFIENGAGNA